MVYGYARCSTDEIRQDIKHQERELEGMGADAANIFCEYESGTKRDRRELTRLPDTAANGDAIAATELSRITRSTKDLIGIIETAKEKRLKLVLGSFEAAWHRKPPARLPEAHRQALRAYAIFYKAKG